MKMKGLTGLTGVLVFLILLSAPSFSYGQDNKVSGSASLSFMSSYVWRGFQLSSDELAVQPGVGISYQGLSLSFWSDYNTDTSRLDETDITVDYSNSVGIFGYSLGYIYYAFSAEPGGGAEDTQEIYGAFSLDTILSPSLGVYYDYDEFDSVYLVASVGHEVSIGNVTVSGGISGSYYFYDDFDDDVQNIELTLGASVPVIDMITIDPMIAYSFGFYDTNFDAAGNMNGGINDEFYGGITTTFSF